MQWGLWQRLRGAPPCLLQSVIVNLKDDPAVALHGVLFDTRGHWFILRQASMLKAGEPPTPVDGELLVPVSNISFLQADLRG